MNTTMKTLATLGLLLVCSLAFGQTAMTHTTLSAAITVGTAGANSGITGSYVTQVSVASATGISVAFNGQPITFLYVDKELFGVLSLAPGQTTVFNVLRAQAGTKAAPHASGADVMVQVVTPQFGGFSGGGGFQLADPPYGQCTAANTLVTPWVNIITGRQWICDSTTTDWLPVLSTGSITPAASSGAIQTTAQTFTLNGVISGEPLVVVNQPAPTSLCPLVAARATAANTVSLYFTTLTAAACTPAAGTYMFYVPLRFY